MNPTQYNLTIPLVAKIIQPRRITLKYSFHSNRAGEILLFINTIVDPKKLQLY